MKLKDRVRMTRSVEKSIAALNTHTSGRIANFLAPPNSNPPHSRSKLTAPQPQNSYKSLRQCYPKRNSKFFNPSISPAAMAQGAVKPRKSAAAPKKSVPSALPAPRPPPPDPTNPSIPMLPHLTRSHRPTGPQRGTRIIKPKRGALISQNKLKKRATSQVTA